MSVDIREREAGQLLVTGELTFASAREARKRGLAVLQGSAARELIIDCAGVTRADSAGLAVLLEWLAWGRRQSRALRLANLPASLLAIARISEVDGLLAAAG